MDDTTVDTSEELERLRVENADLRDRLNEAQGNEPRRGRWRWPVAVLLLIVGGVALAASTLAVWSGRTITDTDRYVETVAPLIDSPAVRSSLANSSVDALFGSVNIEDRAREALPPRADFLAPSIATNLESYARTAAEEVLASQQAQDLWTNVNRRSHEAIMPALLGEGQSPYVDVAEGTVSLDISALVAQVKAGLVSRGISIAEQIPDDVAGGTFTVLQSPALANVQAGLQFLRAAMIWLPIVTLLLFAGAIALAPDRRKAALWLGVVAIVSMLVLAGGMAVLRDYYVGSGDRLVLDASAAAVLFDTLVRFLRNAIRVVAVIGLLITIAAALAGPSRVSREVRRVTTEGAGSVSRVTGLDLGRFSWWVDRHRRALDVAGVIAAGVILLAVTTPTPGLVAGLALAVVLWLLVVEVLAHAHGGPSGQSTM